MSIANELERYMLSLINAERTSRGLSELQLESNLNASAEVHSQWMTDADTFSHTGENSSSPTARMTDADMDLSGSWGTAENIAAVSVQGSASYFDEVDQLHTNLMNSADHRANILDASLDYIGIGIVVGPLTYQGQNGPVSLESVLVTQNFARTQGLADLDLAGEAGRDTIQGASGDDNIVGNAGDDSLRGNDGDDTIQSGDGDDWSNGDAGRDTLEGGAGNDTLRGGSDEDTIYGGAGNDDLHGQRNADTVYGGDGDDYIRGGGGSDVLYGDDGHDEFVGGGRRDTIYGGSGNDTLNGNSYDDLLFGGAGNDILRGGGQNDTLNGGTGDDLLKGGSGEDRFVFALGMDTDTVVDLELGVDTLAIASSLAAGRDAATIVALGTQVGSDFQIDLGGDDIITLEGITSGTGLADMIEIF
jgi:Ca2+-binding RTX toxin-like protein